ncbi:MAG: response regulator SirA [Rhodospirillaceae bacterium]|nr:MAG: response regulator SirA [Rhodospirillaceae bacterium]
MATQTLDTKGLNCPMPVLKTKKALKGLSAGDTLEVESTDPGSIKDLQSLCRSTGNEMIESSEADGIYKYLIKKS